MRWKIISLCTALITVTSAHILTVDNGFIINAPENVPINLEHHNYNIYENGDPNITNSTESELIESSNNTEIETCVSYNSSELASGECSNSTEFASTENFNSTENDSSESTLSTESTPSENSNNTELESIESANSTEHNSSENSDSTEPAPSENSNSTEFESTESSNSTEHDSSENSNITEPESSENPNSKEPESSEIPNSRESRSIEKPDILSAEGQGPSDGSSGEGIFVTENGNTAEELCNTSELHVQTLNGCVKGYTWQGTADIIGFFDIPYGKIEGPFDAPIAAPSWSDVHDAENHTKHCPQLHNDEYVGEMDCLTLSIFTPKERGNVSVLFHIYDAYSQSKSADPMIYGPDHLVPKGVILVLPNFRAGPMGFLCMRNETALGNAGLKDLSLALEWVKDNIHFFGGNPKNIVVSGDGESGAHAGCMALCSSSSYYINKVITESGSALSHLALDRDPIGTATELAETIRSELSGDGVIYNNTFEEVDLGIIIKLAKNMRFNPCLEYGTEPFMNITPWEMLLHNKERDTTFMIGSATFAGAQEAVDATDNFFEQFNANFSKFLPKDLVFSNDEEKEKIAQQLRRQYFGEHNINSSHVEELSLWYTDASYLGPSIRLARPLVRVGAKVYLYEFGFVGSLNRELEAMSDAVPGAVRSDIVGYLFHKDETTVKENTPEERMINLMVDLWVSFINNGKPTAENIEWVELKETEDSKEEWLLIQSETKSMRGVHLDRLRLWTTVYDEHFIENNADGRYQSSHCLALLTLLFTWIANKLNYYQ